MAARPRDLASSFRGRYTLAFGLFVGAAVTDFLDGMIARRFNQRSRLRIPAWLTFTVFIRDFLIIISPI